MLVTTPVDGGRVSHDTCGWRPCWSQHLWMAAVLVTTPVDGGRVGHDTCGWRPCWSRHLWILWSCAFLLLQQICIDAGHVNENALLLGVKNSGGRKGRVCSSKNWNQSPKEDQTGCTLFKK